MSNQGPWKLKVIVASTRPGRIGLPIGEWFTQQAEQLPEFSVELLDLGKINLPFYDEPNHPKMQQYVHQHTKDWSAKIADGDAFIFIVPEYNFSMPATIKNAIDYLYYEWANKPSLIVNYGYISSGTRSAQMLKQVLTSVNIMPLAESVNIPLMSYLDESQQFHADERLNDNAKESLQRLLLWTKHLAALRQELA
jgi:NAD(P)H-dependent FMN reductase